MQPADATPAAQTGPDAVTVPPPRAAPEVESSPQAAAPTTVPTDATVSTEAAARTAAAESTDAGGSDTGSGRAGSASGGLDEREREMLAFERQWWRHAGAKEQAIRDRFGLSATRYYQLLNALLDNPAALAADPVLVGRLVRLRASRSRNRRR
ncbi:DUF3263 domain-containing protein [Micromonospora sp. CP22]|uniref:DUF3263 domain-containing protein n=1 Tax=Micromonospora sp. CP22 TaxID=2580517 RepID=UPI0012BB6230|nr:DUF3263 domain-containing protein [Micromonospora sp. CP22]MTK00582.1 DUF3263 domain-containing protein [Micromonospora sp. CP22]